MSNETLNNKPTGLISQELAREIWNCHNDIQKAENLLKELDKNHPRPRSSDTPEDFKMSLELWLNTNPGSHSKLVSVPADISFIVVQEYKKHRHGLLSELMQRAADDLAKPTNGVSEL